MTSYRLRSARQVFGPVSGVACVPLPGSRHRTYRRVALRQHPGDVRLHPLSGREFPGICGQGTISKHASMCHNLGAKGAPEPWQRPGGMSPWTLPVGTSAMNSVPRRAPGQAGMRTFTVNSSIAARRKRGTQWT